MTALQQINFAYVPEEDRLLLRASTTLGDEYRLWVTRRYAGLLAQVLQERIDKAGGSHQLASDRSTTEQLRNGAMDQAYEGGHAGYPLGEAGVLGYGIQAAELEGGGLSLQLVPREGQGLCLNLDLSLLYLIFNLLEQAVLNAGWNLPLAGDSHAALH